jgi:hypothetical protein
MITCYMCDDIKTSMEHAPPKCFFPKNNDSEVNLITVPSCDTHNSMKSKDDEFLRAVLLLATSSKSDVAANHFRDKLTRGVERNPDAHMAFIQAVTPTSDSTSKLLSLDRSRFDRSIEQIARAVFFHTYQIKWTLHIEVLSPDLYNINSSGGVEEDLPITESICSLRKILSSRPTLGDRPSVFKYRVLYDGTASFYAFGAQFYDAFEVFCFSSVTDTCTQAST